MASLLYGAGLRLRGCLKLRVKDVEFSYRQLVIRDAKGGKDRVRCCPRQMYRYRYTNWQEIRSSGRLPT